VDPETLYRQIGRLLEEVPNFPAYGNLTPDQLKWLGRARALVKGTGDLVLTTDFEQLARDMQGPMRADAQQLLLRNLYNALAVAEIRAPPSAQGAFIPAGNRFDAYNAITKLLQSATSDVLIVDPYLDETVLTEFGGSVAEGVTLRLLGDSANIKPALGPAAKSWNSQYGAKRPVAVRMAQPKALHDRVALIDKSTAWTVTQSLKDFAKRSPAEIVRADDTASLKIPHYENIWAAASVVV
jgi:hypothetical protein